MHDQVEEHLRAGLRGLAGHPVSPVPLGGELSPVEAVRVYDAMAASRQLDRAARRLVADGHGLYSIGSAGHEGTAAVAAALRPTDPALLHYRSGAFYLARASQVEGVDGIRDVLLGLVGAAEEPIAGGRHKVFGRVELSVIPTTSTIGSHLPRAVGLAVALDRARRLGRQTPWPADTVVVAGLGDASVNHSTVAGALNAAGWCVRQDVPVPLLVVCEDNGLGISVPTPPGWVEAAVRGRPGLHYLGADGCDLEATSAAARAAQRHVRDHRRPAFLHLRTVRLMGHAGSDVESAYRSAAEMAADLVRDPVLAAARLLVARGVLSPAETIDRYDAAGDRVAAACADVVDRPRLRRSHRVAAPPGALAPSRPWGDGHLGRTAVRAATADVRRRVFGGRLPEHEGPLTLARTINRTLLDAAAADPGLLVFGQDVARKGGVYGVTRELRRRLGGARVFDTLLDEQAILGLALGAGLAGLLPVPEIQYLAYLHTAEDQVRGEAASMEFFSQGQYRNPMVLRVASFADPHGFGGHFHNDGAVGVLRDVPGLVVAAPAHPSDAAPMLRTCLAAGRADGRVCVVLEPTALYHVRDLYEPGDGHWTAGYLPPDAWPAAHVPLGSARTYGGGADLLLVACATTVPLALRAARLLEREDRVGARVLDMRWISPMPLPDLLRETAATGRVLVVDPTPRTGGLSEGVVAALVDAGFDGPMAREAAADSYLPLGPAAADLLPSVDSVLAAARRLLSRPRSTTLPTDRP